MDPITELTDDDTGAYTFLTATGSLYLVVLDGERSLTRLPSDQSPTEAYSKIPVSELRMDSEAIPLLRIGRLRVGSRAEMAIDILADGKTITVRDTSEVVSIIRLQDP